MGVLAILPRFIVNSVLRIRGSAFKVDGQPRRIASPAPSQPWAGNSRGTRFEAVLNSRRDSFKVVKPQTRGTSLPCAVHMQCIDGACTVLIYYMMCTS